MTVVLDVEDLCFTYPDGRAALQQFSVSVERGERVAVLGPNGSGKTTFVLQLNGTLMPTSGSISVAGRFLSERNLAEIRKRVGLVFQDADDQLFMSSVIEDVRFGPKNLGLSDREVRKVAAEALTAVDAQHLAERSPNHLSGGEKRRVALATTLAMDPEIVVLDEPTSDLDPATRYELGELLVSIPVTQLIVTHDLAFAQQVCPRSIVVSEGAVVADGATSDVLADADLLHRCRLAAKGGR